MRQKNVNPQKTCDHPFKIDIVSDEEEDESETWSKKREDKLWNMPPLLSENFPDDIKRLITVYEPSSQVKLS